MDNNQDKVVALTAMVKQLEQVADTPGLGEKVDKMRERVTAIETKAGVQVSRDGERKCRLNMYSDSLRRRGS